jgi:hypothetical protein
MINDFMKLFMTNMHSSIPNLMKKITERCRPYEKGKLTQDTPTAKNFEQYVNFVAYETLKVMGGAGYPAICEYLSDTAIETDSCIIQLDAKACMNTESTEFRVKKGALQIHCGIAQTSLSSVCKKQIVKGLQTPGINGKPVYTLLTFLRWGYKDLSYFAESVGIAMIPHDQTMVKERAGKSTHELRMLILNPALWIIHSYVPESVLRIEGSAQSEPMSDSETSLPDQSCQIRQMDP